MDVNKQEYVCVNEECITYLKTYLFDTLVKEPKCPECFEIMKKIGALA